MPSTIAPAPRTLTRYLVTEVEVSAETEIEAESARMAVEIVAARGDWDLSAGEEISVDFTVRAVEDEDGEEQEITITLRGPDPAPIAEYDNGAPCEDGDWVVLGHGEDAQIGQVVAVYGRRSLDVRWGRNGQPSPTGTRLLAPFLDRASAEAELIRRGGDLDAQ